MAPSDAQTSRVLAGVSHAVWQPGHDSGAVQCRERLYTQ